MSISSLASLGSVTSIGMGIGCGVGECLWRIAAQKVYMVIWGLELQPTLSPDNGPEILRFESLDREWRQSVIQAPILEGIVFRGVVQPLLTHGITLVFPHMAVPVLLGISQASLLAAITIGAYYGLELYHDFERGAVFVGGMSAIAGTIFGILREKFGLIASIAAHATTNLGAGLLDKYFPEFHESPREREIRLLPPRDRELRLLQEAIQRADAALSQMPQVDDSSERNSLVQLRSNWVEQRRQREAT